jgi:PhzF family phenazine biosynthesis protein
MSYFQQALSRVRRLASFSDGAAGGNPAGVYLDDVFPEVATMQAIAHAVGYSETAFAIKDNDGWRVRYFAPESEVPFCGHATIALGAVLARQHGDGFFQLATNTDRISVEGRQAGDLFEAALQSPSTHSTAAPKTLTTQALDLFGYAAGDLDSRLAPGLAHAGALHLILPLKDRARLTAMRYDLERGRRLMQDAGLATIALVYAESDQRFHARNPFASGGVYEDPATGAAAAALAGYLRDSGWPHGGRIDILQGDDMGCPSRLRAEFSSNAGESVRVSGTVRLLSPVL